ncbi:23S rRNA (pseudouridine(1915)-N(3))-methyltransferase RlmH [Methylocucumis oryzae]|uniref:Ribosomal RNA large subunit methyltransferase H n=1 Tax=Methylocucumis oryzae TaxID=1632867 RepID=A0A0F3IJ49_9GAMM|nr:23S rRNA (pseudouridine(1915)-N(3))-methyltransferase RlmH [Methylocucumis oryzae]KJV06790.1 50S rRNA methyltransferase [Methylocucumis oryzae]
MQIHLITIGNRMPSWVQQGYDEYAKRLPRECQLQLTELSPGKRSKNSDIVRIVNDEGERMLSASQNNHIVTLDIPGQPWTTPQLANALKRWQLLGKNIALLVGGADGLSDNVKAKAQESWSLSPLTFPHPLVRIIIAEQIYRAWSLLNNHPYHR